MKHKIQLKWGGGGVAVVNGVRQLVLSKRLAPPQEIDGLEHTCLARSVITHDAVDARGSPDVTFPNTPKMIDIKRIDPHKSVLQPHWHDDVPAAFITDRL